MTYAIQGDLLENLMDTLRDATAELTRSREREKQLRIEAERGELLNEVQIGEYLKRDDETIRYYRNLGLPSIKIGASRWYVKGMVDDWLAQGSVNRHSK